MSLIFGLFRLAVLLTTLAIVIPLAAGAYIVIAGEGSPPSCATLPGNSLERTASALAFDAKVLGISGPLAKVTFDEAESAARAQVYFEGRTDRVSDVAVCFEDGNATGFMRLKTVFGHKVGLSARGSLDLTGEHPRLVLSSVRTAGVTLPSFLRQKVEDRTNQELEGIVLESSLSLTFSQDRATLSRR